MIKLRKSIRITKEYIKVVSLALLVALATLTLYHPISVDGASGEEPQADYTSPTPINTSIPQLNQGPNEIQTAKKKSKEQRVIDSVKEKVIELEDGGSEVAPVNMKHIFLLTIACMTVYRGARVFKRLNKKTPKKRKKTP